MNASRSDPPGHVGNSRTKSAGAASNSDRVTTAYRDDLSAAVLRRDELLRLHQDDIDRAPAIAALVARRKARIAAGAVGVLGFLAVAVLALTAIARGLEHRGGLLTEMLLASWVAALVVWAAVRVAVGRVTRARVQAWRGESAHPAADVARMEMPHPRAALMEEAHHLEVASIAAPMMAAAMLLPLTLHFLFEMDSTFRFEMDSPARFDHWIVASVAFVGHAHLLFAGLCWRYARKLRARWPAVGATGEAYKALLVTAAACVFPTVFIAPIYVLFTGLIPAPVMFVVARRIVARERAVLDFGQWNELRLGPPSEPAGASFPLPASALRSA